MFVNMQPERGIAMSKNNTPVFLAIALVALAIAVVCLIYALSVKAVQGVQVVPSPTTSTLQVKPNYGMQDAPNVVQVTAPGSYLQGTAPSVQQTAPASVLQGN